MDVIAKPMRAAVGAVYDTREVPGDRGCAFVPFRAVLCRALCECLVADGSMKRCVARTGRKCKGPVSTAVGYMGRVEEHVLVQDGRYGDPGFKVGVADKHGKVPVRNDWRVNRLREKSQAVPNTPRYVLNGQGASLGDKRNERRGGDNRRFWESKDIRLIRSAIHDASKYRPTCVVCLKLVRDWE